MVVVVGCTIFGKICGKTTLALLILEQGGIFLSQQSQATVMLVEISTLLGNNK